LSENADGGGRKGRNDLKGLIEAVVGEALKKSWVRLGGRGKKRGAKSFSKKNAPEEGAMVL